MTATVYTGGTFDLFHDGHVFFLRVCREIAGPAGRVVVGLNRDEFVDRYKGRRPVHGYGEREAILRSCRYVDDVTVNDGDEDSRPAIERVGARFVVIGSDWACRDYHAQMGFTPDWLREHNVTVLYVDRGSVQTSSTEIRRRVRA